MPQPVELRVRGGGHGRVAMTEPDDRDPAAEVEVRAALVVPDAAALAPHDGDVGARVGGEHRVSREPLVDTVSLAAVTPAPRWSRSTRGTPPRAARTAAIELRDDPALEAARVEPGLGLVGREDGGEPRRRRSRRGRR